MISPLVFSAPIPAMIAVSARAVHARAHPALTLGSCLANVLVPPPTRRLAGHFCPTPRLTPSHAALLTSHRRAIRNGERAIGFGHHRTRRALLSRSLFETRWGRAKRGHAPTRAHRGAM